MKNVSQELSYLPRELFDKAIAELREELREDFQKSFSRVVSEQLFKSTESTRELLQRFSVDEKSRIFEKVLENHQLAKQQLDKDQVVFRSWLTTSRSHSLRYGKDGLELFKSSLYLDKYLARNVVKNMLKARQFLLRPPVDATLILAFFLPPENVDGLIGDLEEQYQKLSLKIGSHRAGIWYWGQALFSIFPVLFAFLKKLSGLKWILEFYLKVSK